MTVSSKAILLTFCCYPAATQQTCFPIAFVTMLTLFSSFNELHSAMLASFLTCCFPITAPAPNVILTPSKIAQLAADVNLPEQILRCVQCKKPHCFV